MVDNVKVDIWAASFVADEIMEGYLKARQKHAPMHSPHEGYAVILEELDEVWEEVKRWNPRSAYTAALDQGKYEENLKRMRKEALHVAAMALAFVLEVCDPELTPSAK